MSRFKVISFLVFTIVNAKSFTKEPNQSQYPGTTLPEDSQINKNYELITNDHATGYEFGSDAYKDKNLGKYFEGNKAKPDYFNKEYNIERYKNSKENSNVSLITEHKPSNDKTSLHTPSKAHGSNKDLKNFKDYASKEKTGEEASKSNHPLKNTKNQAKRTKIEIVKTISSDHEQSPAIGIHLDKNTDDVNINVARKAIEQTFEPDPKKSDDTIDKIPSELETNPHSDHIVDTVVESEEDKLLLKGDFNDLLDSNIRSFVFNPVASPLERFEECTTMKNESGHCRYVQHCLVPSILSSVQNFMNNVCIIDGRFIGVCCPEFPVSPVLVNWPNATNANQIEKKVATPNDCGVGTNNRIVGGKDAERKAWPWMVALLNNKKKFFCGGSLINDRYVLTAAHCTFSVPQNRITARLGEYDFTTHQQPHNDYQVIEIKRHGQYTRLTLSNDIALLKLEKPVVFNEFIKTICLPKAEKDYIGEKAVLVGWGHLHGGTSTSSPVLQVATFPVVSNVRCSQMHGLPIAQSVICTSASSKDQGGCNGDSGGPLMFLNKKKRWEVIGAVSWGRRGCSTKFPTVYTRVNHYLDWIKQHSN